MFWYQMNSGLQQFAKSLPALLFPYKQQMNTKKNLLSLQFTWELDPLLAAPTPPPEQALRVQSAQSTLVLG